MSKRHCNEKWKDVKGFENYYQVSHRGRVKSLARVVPMSDGRTYRVSEKILKPAWDGHYFHVTLSKDGKEYLRLVHRLVAEAFIGECPKGMECCHEDGDSTFNHVSNLRWDTHEGNYQDRVRHGTTLVGRRGKYLQEEEVRDLLDKHNSGKYTLVKLANVFNMTTGGVRYHIRKQERT